MKQLVLLAAFAAASIHTLNARAASEPSAQFAAGTPAGVIVRFTGTQIGEVVIVAQTFCRRYDKDAVPLGIFQSGNTQLMTFECKK